MTRLTRLAWISTGLGMLPPCLMIIVGYPWLGAASMGVVVASFALVLRMLVRSDQERHRASLSYAQDATYMGGDPTTVIAALHRVPGDEPDEHRMSTAAPSTALPSRAYDQRAYHHRRGPVLDWRYRPPMV